MRAFRRRLASFALAVSSLQLALLFVAPVSACCTRAPIVQVKTTAEAGEKDCCPAGSHAPGECPLHKNGKSSAGQTSKRGTSEGMPYGSACRMMCDAPHGPQIVLGAIGVLPAPPVATLTFVSSAIHTRAVADAIAADALPDAPPPESL